MEPYKILTCLMPIFILLSGCVSFTSPEGPVKIGKNIDFEDYEGVYLNKGDPEQYLSKLFIKGNIRNVNGESLHWSDIEFVELKIDKGMLRFGAIYEGCTMFSEENEPGKHFEIKDNKIVLDDDIDLLYENLLGVTTSKQTFELDENGNLIHNSRISFVGALLVIPIVGASFEQNRFRKETPAKEYESCVK